MEGFCVIWARELLEFCATADQKEGAWRDFVLFGLVSCWNFGDISRHGGLRGKEKAKIHQLVKRLAVARCPLFSSARHPWSFFRCGKQQQQQ